MDSVDLMIRACIASIVRLDRLCCYIKIKQGSENRKNYNSKSKMQNLLKHLAADLMVNHYL